MNWKVVKSVQNFSRKLWKEET